MYIAPFSVVVFVTLGEDIARSTFNIATLQLCQVNLAKCQITSHLEIEVAIVITVEHAGIKILIVLLHIFWGKNRFNGLERDVNCQQ